MRSFAHAHAIITAAILLSTLGLFAEDVDTKFHNAPASVKDARNPFAKSEAARAAGQKLYAANCASCHGCPAPNRSWDQHGVITRRPRLAGGPVPRSPTRSFKSYNAETLPSRAGKRLRNPSLRPRCRTRTRSPHPVHRRGRKSPE